MLLRHLELLVPSPAELGGMAAVLAIAVLLIGLGAWTGGPKRRSEGDLLCGWSIVILVFTACGPLGVRNFTAVAAVLAGIALVASVLAWRRDGALTGVASVKIAIIAAPFIAIAAAMIPTQWDEFTHWLPNARFLLQFDSFPRADLPENPAVMESYPYAIPLIMFFASRIVGFMATNASAVFSVLLVLSFGLLTARIAIATATGVAGREGPTSASLETVRLGWAACALGALAVTILNPTYVTRLVFSSYADAPTSVAVGFTAVLLWLMTNALADNNDDEARALAWQAGLTATAMVGLKQANLVFLIGFAITLGILVVFDPAIRRGPVLRLALRIFILPLAVYLLWKMHVNLHIKAGEFNFRPYSEWFIREIPEILSRMALIASKKGGYFSIMTIATIVGVLSLWRPRGGFGRLAIISGSMFLSYNAFLFITYVAAFGDDEALRAASYWRYNTHLGGVCLIFATVALATFWHRRLSGRMPRWVPALLVVLAIALPVGAAKKLRFDSHPRYLHAWSVGKSLAEKLGKQDRLLLVDPESDGQYLVIMRYLLQMTTGLEGELTGWSRPSAPSIAKRVMANDITHVWLYDATPMIREALGMQIEPGRSWLLERRANRLEPVASWPNPSGPSRESR